MRATRESSIRMAQELIRVIPDADWTPSKGAPLGDSSSKLERSADAERCLRKVRGVCLGAWEDHELRQCSTEAACSFEDTVRTSTRLVIFVWSLITRKARGIHV